MLAKTHILVVDDDSSVRFGMRECLEAVGHQVGEADSCASAHEAFRSAPPDLALIDYMLPDGNAINLLKVLRALDNDVPVVVLTGHGSIDLAVQAVKEGADDFLTKPTDLEALRLVIDRALEHRRERQPQAERRQQRRPMNPFLGRSSVIRALEAQACRVARSDAPVLIMGETGAGKGVLARWLHNAGPRSKEPFVDLNCAGLSKDLLESELFGHEKGAFTGATYRKTGLLEAADRGTTFLDEIGDMDLTVQPKLLKVIEEQRFRRLGEVKERAIDVRFIAASHQNLEELADVKAFRHDLLYRINVVTLAVPPLRERREDIPLLAGDIVRSLVGQGSSTAVLARDVEDALMTHDWPGNVRELRNVLERALLNSGDRPITPETLGLPARRSALPPAVTTGTSLHAMQLQQIVRTLQEEGGHVERTAHRLGIPRSTLYQKIRKHGLVVADDRSGRGH